MRSVHSILAIGLCALASASTVAAPPAPVAQAVAAVAARSPDNVKLDAGRKPAELLAFLGLEKGMRVADMFGINHYWAEILAPAVGPKGRVIVWEPSQFAGDKARAGFATFAAGHPNVSLLVSPFATPILAPDSIDFMLINLDYHDTYWQSAKYGIARMEPDAWLKTIFAALRPGGIVGVVDHVAAAGSDPRASVEAMHRIDPAVIRADFERAGFVLAGHSDMLRNPADTHQVGVFDDSIRGHTDRVVFKFRKATR